MVLRIAAIGCGDIAQRRHFPQLQALGGTAELVAIAGRDPGRLRDCAARFGVPACYTDPARMLRDEAIDAVLVLTSPDSHADHAELAVGAGKHVMVEKPLVRSPAEAARLVAAVRARQAIQPLTFFALPHVATAEHRLVARLLGDGAIGAVTGAELHRGHRGPSHADWFYRRAVAGGGVLFDLGIYQLATIATLLGPAVRMSALCARHFATRTLDDGTVVTPDVEDSAMISLLLEGGIAVGVHASWNGSLSHHATRARSVVFGREGTLHFGVADGAVYVFRPDGDYRGLPGDAAPARFDGADCRQIRPDLPPGPLNIVGDFVADIRAGVHSTGSLDIQAHVLDIILGAYAAGSASIGAAHALGLGRSDPPDPALPAMGKQDVRPHPVER